MRVKRLPKKLVSLMFALLLLSQGQLALAEAAASTASSNTENNTEKGAGTAKGEPAKAAESSKGSEKLPAEKSPSEKTAEEKTPAAKSAEKGASKSGPEKTSSAKNENSVKVQEKKAAGTAAPVPGKHNSNYKLAEPIADPAGSPTRVHRPGQGSDGLPPVAPPIGSAAPAPSESPMPLYEAPPKPAAREKYPSVGQLEQLMFGHSTPNIVVDNRLDKLESAIFQKSYPDLDIEQRIKKLKEVIVGEEAPAARPSPAGSDSYSQDYSSPPTSYRQPPSSTYPPPSARNADPDPDDAKPKGPFFPNYGHYDLNQELSLTEAEKFAVDVLNELRAQQGLNELSWDELGFKIANEHIDDLVKREAVSHQNSKGENPDLRYSIAGGADSLVEGAIMFPAAENIKITRDLVVKMLEALHSRQDDRECLMFPHASGFALAFKWTPNRHKLFCCTEVVTKHGEMEPIPLEASVGDKIEIKGSVAAPYKFHKITVAYEGKNGPPADDGSEATEALPYFPPLDYEAHAIKSNRDFEKGVRILQIAGITAAIAGGLFIPPVALAAPLIAASVGASTPKPVSEIPIKGGVKTDGNNFSHRLTLNNQGKEGIYYLTVWAQASNGSEILPVSRRAIIATKGSSADNDKDGKDKDKDKNREQDKDPEKNKEAVGISAPRNADGKTDGKADGKSSDKVEEVKIESSKTNEAAGEAENESDKKKEKKKSKKAAKLESGNESSEKQDTISKEEPKSEHHDEKQAQPGK